MTTPSSQRLVEQFNTCINAADLGGLSSLMTDDHVFIDTVVSRVSGKAAVTAAWASFFATFPGYRNEFDSLRLVGEDVVVTGRSVCSDTRLQGPALWRARVRGDKISEWQIYKDTAESRALLGV
jgi:ketosteroid isomerase-like protein